MKHSLSNFLQSGLNIILIKLLPPTVMRTYIFFG